MKERERGEREETIAARVQKAVVRFCEAANVTQRLRWIGKKEQLLHGLVVEEGIDVLLECMKVRVKAHVALLAPPQVEAF